VVEISWMYGLSVSPNSANTITNSRSTSLKISG
jgi:hypothetical protein